MKNKTSYRTAALFIGAAATLVLLCSCISFNIGDWPSRFVYPHNRPPENWCGLIGAFLAYYLLYYIGPGIFLILISACCFFAAKLTNRVIGQPILRSIGLLLLTAAGSSTFYYFWPHSIYDFPVGSGGMLGIGMTYFLRSQFAKLGTFILLSAVWVVGLILLAEELYVL